jgi:hypothetical protein
MRSLGRVILMGPILLLAGAAPAGQEAAQFFASRVVDFSPGVGYERFPDPQLAPGGPRGSGWLVGSLDVVSLGVQGELVLGFEPGAAITDGEGADLIVSENAMAPTAGSPWRFAELIRVGVSTNGADYAFFPVWCGITEAVEPYEFIDSALVEGFAGITPVLADVGPAGEGGNGVDPFDPAAAGGDAFDLADLAGDPLVAGGAVDLARIYFVKLKDVLGDGSELDGVGNAVYDPTGNMDPPYNDETSADVDALTVIHGLAAPPAGDVNLDGKVDGLDYNTWSLHYHMSAMTWTEGDVNGDTVVDGLDYNVWSGNYGYGVEGAAVPEPAGLGLCLGAAAMLVGRPGKRRLDQ